MCDPGTYQLEGVHSSVFFPSKDSYSSLALGILMFTSHLMFIWGEGRVHHLDFFRGGDILLTSSNYFQGLERVKPLLSVFPRFFLGHPYSQTSHLTFIWGGKFHNQPLVFVWSWGHATYIIQIPSKVGTDQSALKGFSSSFVLNIFVLTLAI